VSRRLQTAVFLLGAAVFAVLINHIGVRRLADDLARLGWLVVPMVALHALVYALNAAAWQVILAREPDRPSFRYTYAITVSGFALNFMTPVLAVGGEAYAGRCWRRWTNRCAVSTTAAGPGSLYLAFSLLGLDSRVGVFAGVVSRLREVVWIGIGLLLVWTAKRRKA